MSTKLEGHELLLNRGTKGSLWLADDHLLVIETVSFFLCIRETYRRLDYLNIQAISYARSQRRLWVALLLLVVIGITTSLAVNAWSDHFTLGFLGPILLISLVLLCVHLAKGPTVKLVVQTAVRAWPLTMVTRRKQAEKIIAALTARCEAAQSGLSRPELPTANANATDTRASRISANACPDHIPAAHALATPAWLCLLLLAAMIAGEGVWNFLPATILMLCFGAASFIMLMISFSRGGGAVATGGKAAFFLGVGVLVLDGISCYGISVYSIIKSSIHQPGYHRFEKVSMLKAVASFPPQGHHHGTAFGFVIGLATITAAAGLLGLFAALKQNRLHRNSLKPSESADSPSSSRTKATAESSTDLPTESSDPAKTSALPPADPVASPSSDS